MADEFEKMIYDHNWEDIMKDVIKGIENAIADKLSEGITPTVLLMQTNNVHQLLEFCQVADQVNWANKETGVILDFIEGTVSLRVFRTVDLLHGQIIVL